MLTIILISFFSGILTVLAPCVLPLLPVILGGSLAGQSKKRPYIIITSLIVSLLLFTLLLKASTVLIQVDPDVWEYIAGGLLVLFSITLISPHAWVWVMDKTGIEKLSQNSLEAASHKEGMWWPIALGAALGPVFSSCNPTYTVLLATILPVSMTMGLIGLGAYFVGLGIILLLIVHFGRSIIGRFAFFSNPRGVFRRTLGVIILIVGLLVMTGYIKKVEAYIIEKNIFVNTLEIDNELNSIILKHHNNQGGMCANGKCDEGKDGGLMMDVARAPELTGIATWINSNPLTMESLRGKVVLIDFWTYSCINCIRTQPYLNAWYDKYEKDGLVIIGVHAPEFAFEKAENNVREASQKAWIRYPIALDNDFKTWNAYSNRYWPAKYLIDQNGNIVYKHFWEGKYIETEQKIQELLGAKKELEKEVEKSSREKTPETYLGSSRGDRVSLKEWEYKNGAEKFLPVELDLHEFTLGWFWTVTDEYIQSGAMSELTLRFSAKKIHLVVSFPESNVERQSFITTQITDKDGKIVSQQKIELSGDNLYTIADLGEFFSDGTLMIYVPNTRPVRLHAFTFWD
jgi:cytochrome c biogenesis protein CcdA/thiol-disulfide isomerase/thioredoxin